jgi:hypothetical protein
MSEKSGEASDEFVMVTGTFNAELIVRRCGENISSGEEGMLYSSVATACSFFFNPICSDFGRGHM